MTGDCPFIDPALIDFAIRKFLNSKYDYLSNHLERTYPDGQDIEIFSAKALYETSLNATDPYHRLHVTPYMHGKRKDLSKGNFTNFLGEIDLSFTNASLFMVISAAAILLFLFVGSSIVTCIFTSLVFRVGLLANIISITC